MDKNNFNLHKAIDMLLNFTNNNDLTTTIAKLELDLKGANFSIVDNTILHEGIDANMLQAALKIKKSISQVDVVIHALGIVNSLPYILDEEEIVQYLSLGAGNTGRNFDLETDKRIAEFKFINWSGKSDTIRQNNTFKDFFQLAEYKTDKMKYLYIFDKEKVVKFLSNNRALTSVLSKNEAIRKSFFDQYGDKYNTVSQYYRDNMNDVEIIDLNDVCPHIFSNR